MEKSVALIGESPIKINETFPTISKKLDQTLQMLYQTGYRTFSSDTTRGFGLLACESVLRLRQIHQDVELVAVSQFEGQKSRYTEAEKVRYNKIIEDADSVVFTSDIYYLLDHSALLVCYYRVSCIILKRAFIMNMSVINLYGN